MKKRSFNLTTYHCGSYAVQHMHQTRFNSHNVAGCRGAKKGKTSDVQKKLNDKNAEENLHMLVCSNFGEKDYFLTLTYQKKENPLTIEDAVRDIKNFFRRLKRCYGKQGLELKYIWVLEQGKVKGRLHFHCVISAGIPEDLLKNVWGKGEIGARNLRFGKSGVIDLVKYLLKSPATVRKWSSSHNLNRPVPEKTRIKIELEVVENMERDQEAARFFENLYPEYAYAQGSLFKNEVDGGLYASAFMYQKNANMAWLKRSKRRKHKGSKSDA